MIVPHAYFSKVARVIFIKVNPVMVHTTSITTASRMLPVFADAAVPVADVSPQLPGLPQSGRHLVSVRDGRERAPRSRDLGKTRPRTASPRETLQRLPQPAWSLARSARATLASARAEMGGSSALCVCRGGEERRGLEESYSRGGEWIALVLTLNVAFYIARLFGVHFQSIES